MPVPDYRIKSTLMSLSLLSDLFLDIRAKTGTKNFSWYQLYLLTRSYRRWHTWIVSLLTSVPDVNKIFPHVTVTLERYPNTRPPGCLNDWSSNWTNLYHCQIIPSWCPCQTRIKSSNWTNPPRCRLSPISPTHQTTQSAHRPTHHRSNDRQTDRQTVSPSRNRCQIERGDGERNCPVQSIYLATPPASSVEILFTNKVRRRLRSYVSLNENNNIQNFFHHEIWQKLQQDVRKEIILKSGNNLLCSYLAVH